MDFSFFKLRWKFAEFSREVRYAYQRAVNGYDETAMWDLAEYLSPIIKEVTFKLAKDGVGYPTKLDQVRWSKILKQISFGFGSYMEMQSGYYDSREPEYKRLEKEYKKGMKLFARYFSSFWD